MRLTAPLLLAVTALAGCTVGPNFVRPTVASPSAFAAQPADLPGAVGPGAVENRWWLAFGDPLLSSLIDRLGRQNLDLQTAAERIDQAQAQVRVVRSQGLPQVGANARYVHQRMSPNGFISLVQPAPGNPPLEYDQYSLGVAASWEFDLFGRVRRATEAARANALAVAEARRGVALAGIAELAQTYMQLREAQAQEVLVRRNLAVAQHRADLIRQRQAAGAATTLDLAQATSQTSQIQQGLPQLRQQQAVLENALALLLGEAPHALAAELVPVPAAAQPGVPRVVSVGLPSDLILRRPDIREAMANLHAATAQTGVAVASFYPDLTLGTNFGFDSLHAGSLFDWASRTFSVAPSLSLPIFQGGQLRGNLQLRRSQQREAAIAFHRAVLQAWHDVDNALTAYAQAQQTRADNLATVQADQHALDAAQQRFDQGASDYLNVTAAQAALLVSQNGVVQANAQVEVSLVALYRALGGGWAAVQPEKVTGAMKP